MLSGEEKRIEVFTFLFCFTNWISGGPQSEDICDKEFDYESEDVLEWVCLREVDLMQEILCCLVTDNLVNFF